MLSDMNPFRIAGSIYFVGTKGESSHLIDTGEGLILIDVGSEKNVDALKESIEALGFDLKDIKYILLSHGHSDHAGGVRLLLGECSAKVYIGKDDVRYLEGKFKPDGYFEDGGRIVLGSTEILTVATPGHTCGTFSFFFNVDVEGKVLRAGMFGGAGVRQMSKQYLDKRGGLYYHQRGDFLRSLERLRSEHVDIFLGNHTWNNNTLGKYEKSLEGGANPFINTDQEWQNFLASKEAECLKMIKDESRKLFVNYAHRGASEYAPENTSLSFNYGIFLGANGIETDVQLTRDGTPVLFHDDTLTRMTGKDGCIGDYSYEELCAFSVMKGVHFDRIMKFEDFLYQFAWRDLTFAIELKVDGVEKITADLIKKYGLENKCIVTSFSRNRLSNIHKYAPNLKLGFLTSRYKDSLMDELRAEGIDEFCPNAASLSPEMVEAWHRAGFRVRAWGVANEALMRAAVDAGVDGMTVNFPDKLKMYLDQKEIENSTLN